MEFTRAIKSLKPEGAFVVLAKAKEWREWYYDGDPGTPEVAKSTEEALKIANDTNYGLAAAVWTKDISKAHLMAKGNGGKVL